MDEICGLENSPSNDIIHLNVGGTNYTTSRATFCNDPQSMLCRMVCGHIPMTRDGAGRIVIDRDGPSFRHVLNYLRGGGSAVLPTDTFELRLLAAESDFYCLSRLRQEIEVILSHQRLADEPEPRIWELENLEDGKWVRFNHKIQNLLNASWQQMVKDGLQRVLLTIEMCPLKVSESENQFSLPLDHHVSINRSAEGSIKDAASRYPCHWAVRGRAVAALWKCHQCEKVAYNNIGQQQSECLLCRASSDMYGDWPSRERCPECHEEGSLVREQVWANRVCEKCGYADEE